jgi:hypothetical protein
MRTATAAALALTLALLACRDIQIPEPKQPQMMLERRLQRADVDSIARSGDYGAFEPYDKFSYGHQGKNEATVAELARTKECGRYFNVLTAPKAEHIRRGNPWFDYADTVPMLKNPETGELFRFKWYGNVRLYDWRALDWREFVDTMVSLTPVCGEMFWDQAWRSPAGWMGSETEGVSWRDLKFGHADSVVWEMNFMAALEYARTLRTVVVNGETHPRVFEAPGVTVRWRPLPEPVYIENADWDWAASMTVWNRPDRHPATTLAVSVQSGRFIDSALSRWVEQGGTLAFYEEEESAAMLDALYQRAADLREEKSP